MKITLLVVGKTEDKYLIEGIDKYLGRLKHYINFNMLIIPDIKNTKNLTEAQQKAKEAELILKQINNPDMITPRLRPAAHPWLAGRRCSPCPSRAECGARQSGSCG